MILSIFSSRFFYLTLAFSVTVTCSFAGTVICVLGVSSSGKTSISEALKRRLGDRLEIIEFDQIAMELAQEFYDYHPDPSKSWPEILIDIIKMIGEELLYDLETEMYQGKIKEALADGKHVVFDLVGIADSDIDFLKSLRGHHVLQICVHCSLPVLMQHFLHRSADGTQKNQREFIATLEKLPELFIPRKSDDDYFCGVLNRIDLDAAWRLVDEEINENASSSRQDMLQQLVKAFRCEFIQHFGLDKQEQVEITPCHQYDLLLDTSTLTPDECAEIIERKLGLGSELTQSIKF